MKASRDRVTKDADEGQERAPHLRSPAIRPGYRAGLEPANKGRKFPPEPLSPEEARALIRAVGGRSGNALRNRALLAVLYRGGLRISEALDLKPKDIDARDCSIRVLHGKRDQDRVVGVSASTITLIEAWAAERAHRGITRSAPLFCTRYGTRIYPSYVRGLLARLAKRAGIEKRVHPHCLRHTLAKELREEGLPLEQIQQFLGHRSLDSTSRYLARIAPVELIATGRAREWEL